MPMRLNGIWTAYETAPATIAATRVKPKIRHQSPRTSLAERRSAVTGLAPSRTTTAGASPRRVLSHTDRGRAANRSTGRRPRSTGPPSPEATENISGTHRAMTAHIGEPAISIVSNNAPATAGARRRAARRMARKVVGRPMTASLSTA